MTVLNCRNCGKQEEVHLDEQFEARCSSCGALFMEEKDLNEAREEALKVADKEIKEVDINKWIEKIGDQAKQTKYVEEGFWAKAKRHASKVPFAKEVVTLYYCSIDPKTPLKAKATAVGALAYWILPIDLIPDFLPAVGFVDDATAVFFAYKALSGQITDEHRDKAEQFFVLNRNVKLVD